MVMTDILVVVVVFLKNWKEATVYFCLAVVSGLLVFASCVLGKCLSKHTAPPPALTPYMSRAPSRAQSLHALSYINTHGSLAPTLKLHSPTNSGYSRQTLLDCSRKYRGESEDTNESYPWIFVQNEKKQDPRSHFL